MSMAWVCLPICTVVLVGYCHATIAESDVTPRLTFSYSKSYQLFDSTLAYFHGM